MPLTPEVFPSPQGIERFKKVAAAAQGGVLNGEDVFQLWDTFGFPVDLTELMAQEQGLRVDKEGEAHIPSSLPQKWMETWCLSLVLNDPRPVHLRL